MPEVVNAPAWCQEIVQRWLEPNDRGIKLQVPCGSFWTGHTMIECDTFDLIVGKRWPEFEYQDQWADGVYRSVYINRKERAIFTYCEGDLDLTIDADDDKFLMRMLSAEEFYKGLR